MNQTVLASLVFIATTLSVGLSLAKPSSRTLSSVTEVLNLPADNRRMVIQEQGLKHYDEFVALAFNESQPMSLRWRALVAASEAGGKRSIPDLLRAGKDKAWFMRNAALLALTEVSPVEGDKLAGELIKDKALVVRSAAVSVLDKNATASVRDLLWEELNQNYNFKNKESLWIRHQIVEVLAKKPLNHELKIFAQLLADKDQRVQGPAVRGLEKLTGVKLGTESEPQNTVSLWQNYLKNEKIEL